MIKYVRSQKNGYEIFEISGEFVIGQIGDLLDEYTELIKLKKSKFIFDFTKVDLIDSSGLGTILMGASQVLTNNDKIRICLDPKKIVVKDLFSIVKLDSIMEYYTNLNDAINGTNKISI